MKGVNLARRVLRIADHFPLDPNHELDAPTTVRYMDLLELIATATSLSEVVIIEHEKRKQRLKRISAKW